MKKKELNDKASKILKVNIYFSLKGLSENEINKIYIKEKKYKFAINGLGNLKL